MAIFVRLGWNRHEKHGEMVGLMSRAKVAFLRLKIVLLHDTADEGKLHEDNPY
jgi:hypothetical protein